MLVGQPEGRGGGVTTMGGTVLKGSSIRRARWEPLPQMGSWYLQKSELWRNSIDEKVLEHLWNSFQGLGWIFLKRKCRALIWGKQQRWAPAGLQVSSEYSGNSFLHGKQRSQYFLNLFCDQNPSIQNHIARISSSKWTFELLLSLTTVSTVTVGAARSRGSQIFLWDLTAKWLGSCLLSFLLLFFPLLY